jgi:hypothetical protein
MIDAGNPLVGCDYGFYGRSEIAGICGSAYLIGNHADFFPGVAEFKHCFHKVVTVGRIEPARAYNDRVGAQR